jgi:hypothetical protein
VNGGGTQLEHGARRPHVVAVVVAVDEVELTVRLAKGCGGCRGTCTRIAGNAAAECILRVPAPAGRPAPPLGSRVLLAARAPDLVGGVGVLYGLPLGGVLLAAAAAALADAAEPAILLAAAAGLALSMTYLRLRRPAPPAFEMIDDERT